MQRTCLVAAAALLFSGSAAAQVITGTVTERASGAPLRGAFVAVLRADGAQATAVLSGANGEFLIRAVPGRYSLRIDMIGHATARVAAFDLAAGQTVKHTIALEVAAMRLPELSVRGDRRCAARPETNAQTAAVWAEAKKALEVNAWVQGAAAAVFNIRQHERALDRDLDQVGAAEMSFRTMSGKQAFHAVSMDILARYGFISSDGDGNLLLYGPDAETLLSDVFLDQHCFWLERRTERPGMIGLSFEPTRNRRLPDIAGTLWLDQATAELRHIDYRYVNVDYEDARYAGGRTEFERLRNGAWIVRRWYIRGPRMGQTAAGRERGIVGAHEVGGEILNMWFPGEEPAAAVPRIRIYGAVFDSVAGRGLDGAEVYLSGTQYKTRSAADGSFAIDSVPAGHYYLAFAHPALDSLPVRPVPVRVDTVAAGGTQLATASAHTMIAKLCTTEQVNSSLDASRDVSENNRGLVFGRLDSDIDLTGARVTVAWTRPAVRSSLVRMDDFEIGKPVTGREFMFCAVPVDRMLVLSVRSGQRVLARDSVRIPAHGFVRRDLTVRR